MTTTPAAEHHELRATLDSTRRHVLSVVDGLAEHELFASTLPSGWTPLELVRHLTIGMERYWFHCIIDGSDLSELPSGPRADWTLDTDDTAQSIIAGYRAAIAVSDRILDEVEVGAAPRQPDPGWEAWGVEFPTVRSVMLHVIVETATHAGQLDAAVELHDGRQHLVID